jgi:hypothetical protein
MGEVSNLACKVQSALPALHLDKNIVTVAQTDLPTAFYLECEGFTKGDIGCTFIVAFMLDLPKGELDVRFSYGDESGRKIQDMKTFGFFDDMSPAIDMVRAHLSSI